MQIPVLGIGSNVTLSSGTELHGPHRFLFGNDVFIGEGSTLAIVYEREAPGAMLTFGDGVWCNKRCYFAAANEIVIGKKVIFAPDVYVADSAYDFRDVNAPIMHQGIHTITNRIEIGDFSWIGIRVAILGNLAIGRGCVIAANSVVTKSVPDYCVVAGQPGRVIRAFDSRAKDWVRVVSAENLADILENGRASIPEPHDAAPRIPMNYAQMFKIP